MFKFVATAAILGAAAASPAPKGTFWLDASSGLRNQDINGGAEVSAALTDDATAGGEVSVEGASVRPVNAWVKYSSKVGDMDTDAKATYDFDGGATTLDVDMESSDGLVGGGRTRFGATFGSKVRGFVQELRATQDLSLVDGRKSTVEASYDVPSQEASATLHQSLGDDTNAELGWKQAGNAASLKLSQKVPSLGGEVKPEVDLRSGDFRCAYNNGDLNVDVGNDKVANFEWEDNSSGNGGWKTSGSVPLDSWQDGSVSVKRSWNF